jgi:hypothetical protein
MKLLGVLGQVLGIALIVMVAGSGEALAAEKNKCGCYKDGSGTCFCDKKAKCGCPGDCEPKGCNEQREKQIQKEIEAETRRASESDRLRRASSSSAEKADRTARAEKPEKAEPGARAEKPEPGPPPPAPGAKKLTSAQAKQLVKLLDVYFKERPDSRAKNVEEVRNELSVR